MGPRVRGDDGRVYEMRRLYPVAHALWLLHTPAGGHHVDNSNIPPARKLTDAERVDRLRLIRSDNVGPRGIMAQTPQGAENDPGAAKAGNPREFAVRC